MGKQLSCGCSSKGHDTYNYFDKNPDYANRDTILYLVEIRKQYQKIGIAFNVKRRFRAEGETEIFYERILPRAKARCVEYLALMWTADKQAKLIPKKFAEMDGSTELRDQLNIDETINMIEQLANESEEMTWKELWGKYGLSTAAEPQYVSIPKDIP